MIEKFIQIIISSDGHIVSAAAAATISPYRMNPGYRRPNGNPGESSDHGYSTMTPHDDSENLTYADLAGSSLFPPSGLLDEDPPSSTRWSDNSSPVPLERFYSSGQQEDDHEITHLESTGRTTLSSPKRIGPNKLIVPVTVHMVDTV